MRTFASLTLLLGLVVCLSGCAGITVAPVIPPVGFAFTNTSAPLDIDYDNTDLGSKVGEASTFAVLGLFAFGDASSQAAARNGSINVIKHADYKQLNLLFLLSSYTTIVYGD